MLRRVPVEEVEEALCAKILRAATLPGSALHAACGPSALATARAYGLDLVGYAEAEDLLAAARAVHGPYLLRNATFGLDRRWPQYSARRRLTSQQGLLLAAALSLLAASALLLPLAVFGILLSAVSGTFFLSVVAVRVLCLFPPVERAPEPADPELSDAELPTYSVLVPLFRETAVLTQLIRALSRLRYPADKLDIKLILEETDCGMQSAVAGLMLDQRFEVIVVPAGRPQTKPRALNYALQFCRGELVAIYDAEDVPQSDQLAKAAQRFAASPPDLACLQAQLTFYNPYENWLTRQFTAEYATLFGVLLPVLANHGLPLLLGGTSNHFRTSVLRRVGAWDPFNVTEDADLGLRLARLGYDTAMLDSLTYEEANMQLMNWLRQRTRWLKGYLATWLVHMREPGQFVRDVGPAGFWAAQALTIGVFASSLLHPLCMAATLLFYVLYPTLPEGAGLGFLLLAGLNLLVLLAGYATGIVLTRRALAERGFTGWWGTLAGMPVYWMLMSVAAWMALWQFIIAPFHWNKTQHGLSRQQRHVSRSPLHGTPRARRQDSRRSSPPVT